MRNLSGLFLTCVQQKKPEKVRVESERFRLSWKNSELFGWNRKYYGRIGRILGVGEVVEFTKKRL
tara:strand:+ start:296 stop:490 length:195 start_codon:yes stop_codon:yes gene_type:complete